MAPNQEESNAKQKIPETEGSCANNLEIEPRKMPRFEIEEDIVISGIAGRFPESDTLDEFADNLYKNINMITLDDRRWPVGKFFKKFGQPKRNKNKCSKVLRLFIC